MRKFQINKAGREHISLVTNVSAAQISESDTHFTIKGIPVVVDGAEMNGIIYNKEDNDKGLDTLIDKVLTLGHPFSDDGLPIDAYSSKALQDNFAGGVVTNRYKSGAVNLVDVEIKKKLLLAQDGGEWYFNQLQNKKPIGVSTGLYHVVKDGKSTEQMYNHLALLPENEAPAGGDATFIRFNSAKTFAVNVDRMVSALENSNSETSEALRAALQKKYGGQENTYFYVEDYNDDEVVFCLDTKIGSGSFKSAWVKSGSNIELVGEPIPVKRKTVWMQVNEAVTKFASMFKISNNEAAANGENEGKIMDRNQIIALLTGKGIQVNQNLTDAELLAVLDKSLAGNSANDNKEQKGEVVANEAIAAAVTAAVNAAVKPLSDEVKALKEAATNAQKSQKDAVIASIMAVNAVYTKEELEAMPETALNKMASQFVPAAGLGMQLNAFAPAVVDEFKDYDMNAAIVEGSK